MKPKSLRKCVKCEASRTLDRFPRKQKPNCEGDWYWPTCKDCYAEDKRNERANNLEARRQKDREYYQANKDKARESYVKRTYGITTEDYRSMVAVQNGKCLICLKKPDGLKRDNKLYIDHDHATGKVRGLLCNRCNSAIGLLDETPENLHRAIGYLRRFDDGSIG